MDELNGRVIALQILITGLIAQVASEKRDPVGFLTEFRDEVRAVVSGVRITGGGDAGDVRATALSTVDELFSLLKPPSVD